MPVVDVVPDLDEEYDDELNDLEMHDEMDDGMDDVASPGPVVFTDMDDSSDGADDAVPRLYGRGQRLHKAPDRYSP